MAKIMVVDDDHQGRMITSKILENEGHEIIEAENGIDCLKKLKNGLVPDLILLDIMMPEIDGWDVCRVIKAHESLNAVPVCMFSIRKSPSDLSTSEACEAEWHLERPVSIKKLIQTVDFVLTVKNTAIY
jgi:CheY-like chemotaxis protein